MEFIYLFFLLLSRQHDQLVGVYSDRLKKRGFRHASGSKKGGGGTHSCTGHICECPPPRPHHWLCGSCVCVCGYDLK